VIGPARIAGVWNGNAFYRKELFQRTESTADFAEDRFEDQAAWTLSLYISQEV
jgi:hypothetical protein